MQILIKKVNRNLHIKFEQSSKQSRELPSIDGLMSFLGLQFQNMESVAHKERPAHSSHKTVSLAVLTEKSLDKCKLCNIRTHALYHIIKFLQLSKADRLKYIQSQTLCVLIATKVIMQPKAARKCHTKQDTTTSKVK